MLILVLEPDISTTDKDPPKTKQLTWAPAITTHRAQTDFAHRSDPHSITLICRLFAVALKLVATHAPRRRRIRTFVKPGHRAFAVVRTADTAAGQDVGREHQGRRAVRHFDYNLTFHPLGLENMTNIWQMPAPEFAGYASV
jgi:hypothetical protein